MLFLSYFFRFVIDFSVFIYLCIHKPMKRKNYVEITVKVMVAATAP